jgi:glycosyltransferase domain-containing protein
MNDLLQKITLVIPTHYRHHYLERVLTYYRGSGLVPLVIDSTNVPFPKLAEFPDVDYRHCPDMPLLKKLTRPVEDIATPYVVFCADDSFVVPRAMAACAAYLDAHPDYHTASGRQVSVTRKGGELVYAPCYVSDARMRIDADDAGQRLLQLFDAYSPTFYATHRTGNMQDFVRLSTGQPINDVMLELVAAMSAAINGKHKVLPQLYHVTEIVPSILDDKKRRLPGADAILCRPEHAAQREAFVAVMSGFFERRTGCGAEAARAAVETSVAAFLSVYGPKPRRSFWQKLPRYAVNTLAGLGWRSKDYGSWAETRAQKAREDAGPGAELAALMALFDEKARTELDSIRAVMTAYYADRP